MKAKETRFFSAALFGHTVKNNFVLALVITLIFCLFTVVTNAASYLMTTEKQAVIGEAAQEEFFRYLSVLAACDEVARAELSYGDFAAAENHDLYESVFERYNREKPGNAPALDADGFQKAMAEIEAAGASPRAYVDAFEYAYALRGQTGVFSGKELNLAGAADALFASMGFSREDMERLREMDYTAMLTRVYYTAMGALILFLFVIIAANTLIAGPVDSGSMAYFLSVPNRRAAVTVTQLVYMVLAPLVIMAIACALRIVTTRLFFGEVHTGRILCLYGGMYLLVQAIAGICFMCSCLFNESRKSIAFGGGFAIWCFLAALLGMFGSAELIQMGIGVEPLGVFNKMTLVSLFDINAIQSVGTGTPDTSFLPKLGLLAVIAVLSYMIGIFRFSRKDLSL